MSRPAPLTLTEELEKLEQSITLTLQEIDHNFSRAHRIVTSSILPIVTQYGDHSRQVWDGSKFWKQFFESSANVSLSGYEEQPSDHSMDETVTESSSNTTHTSYQDSSISSATPSSVGDSSQHDQTDADLISSTLSSSQPTPRALSQRKQKQPTSHEQEPSFADYPSPYEALRSQVDVGSNGMEDHSQQVPSTPGALSSASSTEGKDEMVETPRPSKFNAASFRHDVPTSIPRPSTSKKKDDPLLHRVLDRNYRIQATPMNSRARYASSRKSTKVGGSADASGEAGFATPTTAARARLTDSILSSSPDIPEPPQLHSEIFASPMRRNRVPGVSVLTPHKAGNVSSQYNAVGRTSDGKEATRRHGIFDSDDEDYGDDDEDLTHGQSPPKTMQFHVPQSRLLKTPG